MIKPIKKHPIIFVKKVANGKAFDQNLDTNSAKAYLKMLPKAPPRATKKTFFSIRYIIIGTKLNLKKIISTKIKKILNIF
jgi:hypothetical protein